MSPKVPVAPGSRTRACPMLPLTVSRSQATHRAAVVADRDNRRIGSGVVDRLDRPAEARPVDPKRAWMLASEAEAPVCFQTSSAGPAGLTAICGCVAWKPAADELRSPDSCQPPAGGRREVRRMSG